MIGWLDWCSGFVFKKIAPGANFRLGDHCSKAHKPQVQGWDHCNCDARRTSRKSKTGTTATVMGPALKQTMCSVTLTEFNLKVTKIEATESGLVDADADDADLELGNLEFTKRFTS